MKKLRDKVALITGAATGIGKATAKLFAQEGAKVAIVDIKDPEANETVKEIKDSGGEATFIHVDLSQMREVEDMVRKTVEKYGRIDIFFHNAGIAGPGYLDRTTEEGYNQIMAINLKAGFFGAKYAAQEMRKTGGGCMLFTSSGSGYRPSMGSPTYSISKAGVIMLTRNLATYLARDNIRVNCLCPGPVLTPQWEAFIARNPDTKPEQYEKAAVDWRPMKRFGTPEEMAKSALFLASDDASYITGVALPVDGGGIAAG